MSYSRFNKSNPLFLVEKRLLVRVYTYSDYDMRENTARPFNHIKMTKRNWVE
jgi:hypothetical protein